MAQKSQRERTTTNTNTTLPDEKTPGPVEALKRGFLSLLSPSRVDRTPGGTATAGAQPARPKSMWRRLLFGMLIFIVAMQVFEYALAFIGVKFSLHLERPMGASIPLVGGMSRFTFIFFLFMLVLYVGLLRFNVIPNGKDMRAQRAAASQPSAPAAGTSRAARRHAARHAATTSTATASVARRTANAAKAKVQSARTKVKSAPVTTAGISDDMYERVKAAQRSRRRREGKR